MVFEVRDLWPAVPIALSALNNKVLQVLARWLERWAYKNASAVVALSPGMRDGILKTGYSKQQVAVIPNGSDILEFNVDSSLARTFRSKRAWLGNRPLIVYAGTFGYVNGVEYLVDLAAEISIIDADVRILLIGDGKYRGAVEAYAKERGVLDVNVFIEPPMPKSDMPQLLSAADMAASVVIDVPILAANSANKFFDALAAGVPILLNYAGWQAELLEKNGAGMSTYGITMPEAARAVVQFLNDKKRLTNASNASKRLAISMFDRGKLVDQVNEVLTLVDQGQVKDVYRVTSHLYP